MDIQFFSSPFSQKLIQAFSWTLIHSLWQGLILAISVAAMLISTRKAKPALRYNLLVFLLISFILTGSTTFLWEYQSIAIAKNDLTLNNQVSPSDLVAAYSGKISLNFVSRQQTILKALMNFCSENAAIITGIWFLFFLLKSLKAATGLVYIHRIRHRQIYEVGESWAVRLSQLGRKLKISRPVQMVESAIVQIPMVTGFLRPMILVPAGFLTNLPFNQVEAILLHELAHIKRRDYLVNLFQSFAENVFFFNPAVLWVSALIREEREHCCDDLAIEITQNKASFVKALVVFQEYKMKGSMHSLAFATKRNHLLDRVKRILYNNNKQLDAMEKLFVTASLLTAAALSAAFSSNPLDKRDKLKTLPQKSEILGSFSPVFYEHVLEDTLPSRKKENPSGVKTIQVTRDDKRYEIVERDGKINELKIDGKTIPKEKIESYKSEIEPIMEDIEEQQEIAEMDREHAEVFRAEADIHRKEANELRLHAEEIRKQTSELHLQSEQLRKQADEMRMDAEKQRKLAEEFRSERVRDKKHSDEFWAKADKDFEKNAEEFKKQAEAFRKDGELSRKQADEMRGQAEVMRKQADEMRATAEVSRKKADKMRDEYEKMQTELIDLLIKEGVIKDKANLSYKLSNDELIVNGAKQSDALHAKLRSRFLKDKSVEMVYNWKGRTGYTTTGLIYTK